MFPRRSATTHTETLNDELCIYEWERKEVHALNTTAAHIWQMCDGRTSVDVMATTLAAELGIPDAHDLVWLALATLNERHLLDGGVPARRGDQMSRRALIGRLGATAALLPIVTSIVAPTPLQAQSLNQHTFNFTGVAETFTVPAGVTSIIVDAYGAAGGTVGSVPPANPGGNGGRVQATLAVAGNENLTVMVGGAGGSTLTTGPVPGAAGFNGGAVGGTASVWSGGGGGGGSDVSRGVTKLVAAGGGGGGAIRSGSGTHGGDGGGTVAEAGDDGITGGGLVRAGGGGGGTQSAGGAAGAGFGGGSPGSAGSAGTGGAGASAPTGGAGGGGGGYFGGGGGGGDNDSFQPYSAGGGGGSSYTDPGAAGVTHTQGANTGDGRIIISW